MPLPATAPARLLSKAVIVSKGVSVPTTSPVYSSPSCKNSVMPSLVAPFAAPLTKPSPAEFKIPLAPILSRAATATAVGNDSCKSETVILPSANLPLLISLCSAIS